MNCGEPAAAHRYADLGDVSLHYVEAGEGPLVVLLHGFPEFWWSWRFQIPVLAEAGFRVAAPDLRGYNLSSKPKGAKEYRVETLARDVVDIVLHLGEDRASVVGHDWGGAVAWMTAMRYPEVVERLVVLNCPHPETFLRKLWTPRQLRKSWYMFALQVPGSPGKYVQRKILDWTMSGLRRDSVRPGTVSEEDIRCYEEAMLRPGALTAAANYYRALFRRNPARTRASLRKIEAPTLVVWGERDRYLGVELAETDAAWVPNLRLERLPDASHWVQQDAPERVNELLLESLGRPKPTASQPRP